MSVCHGIITGACSSNNDTSTFYSVQLENFEMLWVTFCISGQNIANFQKEKFQDFVTLYSSCLIRVWVTKQIYNKKNERKTCIFSIGE